MKSIKSYITENIKKTTAGAVLTLALMACMMLQVFAATGQISFSDPTAQTGSEVNVTMKISADDDAKLANANVVLSYDADKLEFVAGTDADGGAGTIRVHGASNGAGTSTLEYNLKFNASAAGTAAITISTQEVYDDADQLVQMSHLGSSAVSIAAEEAASSNADLASLNVSPGSLSEAFSADVTSYSVVVGPSVDSLIIDAPAADGGANVIISGNEGLQMGENTVTVRVTAADGVTTKDYTINVTKQEGGAEATDGESQGETMAEPTTEGVKLSSTGKTITIMSPGDDVQIPEGFKSGTISVDGHRVQGWVWGADTDPEYCVVYGMNENGELNFYRYDMAEKTIQRYFEDPLAVGSVSGAQYTELQQTYDSLVRDYDLRFLLICILGMLVLILFVLVVYLIIKLRNASDDGDSSTGRTRSYQQGKSRGRSSDRRRTAAPQAMSYDYDNEYGDEYADEYADDYEGDYDDEADLSHDYSYKDETPADDEPVPDETQVLEPVKSSRRKQEASEKKEKPSKQENSSDIFDDEFDTFDI